MWGILPKVKFRDSAYTIVFWRTGLQVDMTGLTRPGAANSTALRQALAVLASAKALGFGTQPGVEIGASF